MIRIRRTLAIFSLFGGLFLCSSCLQQSGAQEHGVEQAAYRRGLFRRFDSRAADQVRGYVPPVEMADRPSYSAIETQPVPETPDVLPDNIQELPPKALGGSPNDRPGDEPAENQPPIQTTEPSVTASDLSPEMVERRDRIRQCLAYYFHRIENAAGRSPWGIMHTLIAFGVDTEIFADSRKVNAIGWLCYNGPCRGQRLFYTSDGKLQASEGPGVQGHPGQFLAMLAQSRVKRDFPIRVDGRQFTVADLIEYEKRTCRPHTELTFKLIAMSYYLDSDATWKDALGQNWSVSRLIQEELAQPIIGATCGGTHRLTGFSYAVRKREKEGLPMTGQFARAHKYLQDYHDYTFQLQNPDGSFSTSWFEGRGDWGGEPKKLQTTGHILEWLAHSLPKEKLQDARVLRAVDFLTNMLWNSRAYDWEIGPRGHALHALVWYDQRMFGAVPGQGGPKIARSETTPSDK